MLLLGYHYSNCELNLQMGMKAARDTYVDCLYVRCISPYLNYV